MIVRRSWMASLLVLVAVSAQAQNKRNIVVSFDGRTEDMTTSQLLAYAAQHTKPGQRIPVSVITLATCTERMNSHGNLRNHRETRIEDD